MFMETSAKAGHNVNALFKKIATTLLQRTPTEQTKPQIITIDPNEKMNEQNGNCAC